MLLEVNFVCLVSVSFSFAARHCQFADEEDKFKAGKEGHAKVKATAASKVSQQGVFLRIVITSQHFVKYMNV